MVDLRWPGYSIGNEIDDIAIGYAVELLRDQFELQFPLLESDAWEVGQLMREWWESRGYTLVKVIDE